ncbi:MAG: marine proteobacterial sortase target protein [Hyphomicrobium sp.]
MHIPIDLALPPTPHPRHGVHSALTVMPRSGGHFAMPPSGGVPHGGLAAVVHFCLVIVVAIAALLSAMATAQSAPGSAPGADPAPSPKLVTPSDMRSGALLLTTTEQGRYVEAPRLGADYDITISGPTARGRVSQIFHNPTEGWVEAVYVYPLSEGAAVDSLKMVIGSRVVVADIKERQEAKRVFEAAKAAGQKAALVEQERPNMFTNTVANIGPGETVVIELHYQEPVKQSADTFSLRIPLVVGPRYNPPPLVQVVDLSPGGEGWGKFAVDPVPDRDRIEPPVLDPAQHAATNPVTISVRLAAGFPLGEVKSHHHAVDSDTPTNDPGDTTRVLKLSAGAVPADRDFELTWKPAAAAAPSVGLFRERVGDSDYVLAFVTPPVLTDAKPERRPREVVLVIDNSGSMGGTSIREAKASLLYALGRLQPEDRFNVIRFDNTFDVLHPDTVPATTAAIADAKRFVERLQANGGTEMVPAMQAALTDPRSSGEGRQLRQVVFLTDGAIGNENQLIETVAGLRGRSRVFMVGIGTAPNSFLMTRVAETGRGAFTHIASPEQVEGRMRALFEKLEQPVVTGVSAEFTGNHADTTPETLPDLYRGEPLVITARIANKVGVVSGAIDIAGSIGDQPWMASLPLAAAAEGKGLSKLWARRKIADAEVARTLRQITAQEADQRILALALEHHLVSRLTSLVAVDKTPSRADGARLTRADIPLNLPAGWDFEKVFGDRQQRTGQQPSREQPTGQPQDIRAPRLPQSRLPQTGLPPPGRADASPPSQQMRVAGSNFGKVATSSTPRSISTQQPAVPLPKTATDAELRLMIGFALLLTSALVLALRRRKQCFR